jgi:hypothetical protein
VEDCLESARGKYTAVVRVESIARSELPGHTDSKRPKEHLFDFAEWLQRPELFRLEQTASELLAQLEPELEQFVWWYFRAHRMFHLPRVPDRL